MLHFWMQFSNDVAVFGRCCQFEILIVPESFQKDCLFVDHHLVDLWRLCCFFPRKLLLWTEIWEFCNVFWFTVEGICWSADQLGPVLLSFFIKKYPSQSVKSYASHFPWACLVKRDMADVHIVSGVLYNLSSLFEFRLDWTPNKTHGKQNAPSRNLESASHRNLFSQQLTKWRLEFEHSTDTGKLNSLPGFKHILFELELVLVAIPTQAYFLENFVLPTNWIAANHNYSLLLLQVNEFKKNEGNCEGEAPLYIWLPAVCTVVCDLNSQS